MKSRIPKSENTLEKAFSNCQKRGKFKEVYDDIDEFRIQRNFALYKPKAWEDVKKEDVKQELDKIRKNFKILVRLL